VWENVLPEHGKIQNPREQLNISAFGLQGGTVVVWLLRGSVPLFITFWLLRGSVVQVPERGCISIIDRKIHFERSAELMACC
jgi:hypothetical protein